MLNGFICDAVYLKIVFSRTGSRIGSNSSKTFSSRVLHLEPETDNIEIQRTRRYTVNFKQATAIKVIKPQRIIKNNIEDYKESTLGIIYNIYIIAFIWWGNGLRL